MTMTQTRFISPQQMNTDSIKISLTRELQQNSTSSGEPLDFPKDG